MAQPTSTLSTALIGTAESEPNAASDEAELNVKGRQEKPEDLATGPRLFDLLIKLKNLYLKSRFFLFMLIRGRSLDRPYYIHYQITRRCNFRCVSCRVWREETFAKGLSLDEMRILARNLRIVGVKSVALTGGEPLLRKDIVEIVKIFRAEGFIIRLQSNGFLLSEGLMERLFRAGVSDLMISFDSLDLDTFNRINGTAGTDSFLRVTNAIKTAAVMSKRFAAGVFLGSVLRRDNVDEALVLHQFAKDLGILIIEIGMEVPSGNDPMNVRVNDPSLIAGGEERIKLEAAFGKLLETKHERGNALSVSARLLADIREFYADPARGMHWNCRAGRLFMAMLPDGSICICNGAPPIPGYNFSNLPELYSRSDREQVFAPFRKSCGGCICMRQLEHIADDRADLLEKGLSFAKSMLGLS